MCNFQAQHCTFSTACLYHFRIRFIIRHSASAHEPVACSIYPSFVHSLQTSSAFSDQKWTASLLGTGFFSHALLFSTSSTDQLSEPSQTSSAVIIFKSAEIRSSIAVKMGDETINVLIEIIHSVHFEVGSFTSVVNHVKYCKEVVQCDKDKVMIESGFEKDTSQKVVGHNTDLAPHCKRDVITDLHELVCLVSTKSNFILAPAHE